ncbi:DUF5655 domain-containing protein [Pseudorhodoferax sp. Leaf267]|uniref:DUF5655 domain-containing protein n=1 Tax=Pseudorhodoferax sp. Leaf267 TaxID=1736316 RepID=UPI000702374B|nr:DUF5655 domain-containing protein [Pseudorhodoferax sp. Leaf267]KQP21476.1 transporter [Pseudorhodoferax sp. Leaf267]
MSDIQLFRLSAGRASELPASSAALERQLQALIEAQMETFLGVRFLATEYTTGKTHRGRIDSLGLDENACPVIVEYKRHSNENVINQGLFYLDWLLDHKAEFRWLVMDKLGREVADSVEWAGTRLLCIAADFTRYDQHAVQQIPRNIELIRYKQFGDDLLLLELVNTQSVPEGGGRDEADTRAAPLSEAVQAGRAPAGKDRSMLDQLESAPESIRQLYADLRSFVFALGDDVNDKQLKLYTAFRKLKNFTTVVVQNNRLLVYLKLDPDSVALEEGFSRDVRASGHWGTGDVELSLRTPADLERASPLIERA